jgi:acyl-CoA synthetase (AMP-forming)/AMP-acid ligase II
MNAKATVFRAISDVAARRDGARALSGNGRTWTYRELVATAERLATGLVELGCRRDSTIAVVADNNALSCLVYLAAARAGTTVSMVNSLFQANELAVVLENLQPRVIFCDAAHVERCRDASAKAGLDTVFVLLEGKADGLLAFNDLLAWPRYDGPHPSSDDLHEITYTSGTTSAPKGAALTHAAVLHRGLQEVDLLGVGDDDAAIVITPLFHQSGIRNTVLVMWLCGGHAVVAPKFSPSDFWEMVCRYRATFCCMVETILLFLERLPPSEHERRNTLRRVLGAGDPSVVERCEKRFGLRFTHVYGMTENGVPVAVPRSVPYEDVLRLRRWREGVFLAGWPLDGTEVRLMGPDGPVQGEGATGEIQMRSRNLLREYFRRPEATREAFVDGWFCTGDMAMYGPGGALYFVDRIKDVIRRGGENIASKQVEDVLNQHPAVARSAVFPVPDPLFMQEVKAALVLRPGASASPEDLWQWCSQHLAAYKVPRYIEFRDTLPTNASDRVQKQLLRAEGIAGQGVTHDRRAAMVQHDRQAPAA